MAERSCTAFAEKQLCVLSESKQLQPSESPVTGPERRWLVQRAMQLFRVPSSSATRFPSSQPCSIRRHELPRLRDGYMASLKSDGIRFLLLLTRYGGEPRAVMIDRVLNVYEVEVWGNESFFDDTLLDGELVWEYDQTPPRLLYLAFDMVALAGASLLQVPYAARVERMHASVLADVPALSEEELEHLIVDENCISARNNFYDLRLAPKRVVPLEHVRSLWDGRRRLSHMNDGLIFTPNAPVRHERPTYKWKPENTVDVLFRCDASGGGVRMWVRDGPAIVSFERLHFDGRELVVGFSRNAMIESLAAGRGEGRHADAEPAVEGARAREFVAECACTLEGDRVHVFALKLRADKTSPNNVTTIVETLHNIVEDVSIDELGRLSDSAWQTEGEGPPSACAALRADAGAAREASGAAGAAGAAGRDAGALRDGAAPKRARADEPDALPSPGLGPRPRACRKR